LLIAGSERRQMLLCREATASRLELLHELVSSATLIAFLVNPNQRPLRNSGSADRSVAHCWCALAGRESE
jgi:hypothetical protein